MPPVDLTIRLAGEGGEGVMSCGELLTQALARGGWQVLTVRVLPPEIKGGPAMFQVRVSGAPLHSHRATADVLVCFNEEGYLLQREAMVEHAALIHDAGFAPNGGSEGRTLAIPFADLAADEAGSPRAKNLVVLGALGGLLNLDEESLQELAREKFGKFGEQTLNSNLAGLRAGRRFVEQRQTEGIQLPSLPAERGEELIVSGNEAIGMACLHAGAGIYAGYPITPASEILHYLARHLPHAGGKVVQTEDEIAALAVCVGASFAGRKAVTATSGPGLSLMVELIGLAAMAEIPVVIVDCQRSGPSTGMPTKFEQGDLELAWYGGHGDAPRIVLAPCSVEDCFYLGVEAFNLAEITQGPVVVLSDQTLATRTQTIPCPDFAAVEVVERQRLTPETADRRRYADSAEGSSPMPIPGRDEDFYVATGLEHDTAGHPEFLPHTHQQMSARRHRKLELALQRNDYALEWGDEEAEVGLLAWGSTAGAIQEAIAMAAADGRRLAALQLRLLRPFPVERVRAFCRPGRRVICPEANYTGQLARLVRAECGIEVDSHTAVTGLPFQPREIYSLAFPNQP